MITENSKVVRKYKAGYEVREEVWKIDDTDEGTIMQTCYTPNGDWIGDKKTAHFICTKMGIKPEKSKPEHCVCSIGFNEKEQKWYGWSHRAIFGFGIGSTCKKGDCHYTPSTPQELFESITKKDEDGYQWQKPENVEITKTGVRIKTNMCKCAVGVAPVSKEIIDMCDTVIDTSGNALEFEPCEPEYWEIECGKGEWTATTLEEARQMAIDFADSVS